jgi:hypothetical protein
VFQIVAIPSPGAKMSTQGPKFDQPTRASVEFVAPTTIAPETEEGDHRQASSVLLPAPTTYVTPELIEAATASFMDGENVVCKLMFATAGWTA